MVLPFKGFRGYVVIEFAITLAPVDNISIIGRFISSDIDMFAFSVGNFWKGFIQ